MITFRFHNSPQYSIINHCLILQNSIPFLCPVQKKSFSKQGTMAVKGSVAVGIYPRRRPVQTASSLGNVATARCHSQGLAREEATRKETAGEEASLGSAFPTTPVTNQGQPSNWPQVLNLYRPLHLMPTKICHPKNFLAPRQPSIQEPSCWGKIEEKCFNAKDGDLLKDNTLFKTKQGSSCHGRVSTIEAKQHNNDSSSRCLTLSWARINPKKPRIPPVYCQTHSNVSWNICRCDHGPTLLMAMGYSKCSCANNRKCSTQISKRLTTRLRHIQSRLLPSAVVRLHPAGRWGCDQATKDVQRSTDAALPPATTATPNTSNSNSKSITNPRKHSHSHHSNDYYWLLLKVCPECPQWIPDLGHTPGSATRSASALHGIWRSLCGQAMTFSFSSHFTATSFGGWTICKQNNWWIKSGEKCWEHIQLPRFVSLNCSSLEPANHWAQNILWKKVSIDRLHPSKCW